MNETGYTRKTFATALIVFTVQVLHEWWQRTAGTFGLT